MTIELHRDRQPAALRVGVIAEGIDHAFSRVCEERIPFGNAVMSGTKKGVQVKNYNGDGKFLGIAKLSQNSTKPEDEALQQYDMCSVMEKGTIWVEALEPVTPEAKACIDHATSKYRPANTIVVTADQKTDINAEFLTETFAPNQLAILKLHSVDA